MGLIDSIGSAVAGAYTKAKDAAVAVEQKAVELITPTPPPGHPSGSTFQAAAPQVDVISGASTVVPPTYDLSDPSDRKALIESSGQVNSVSKAAGNQDDICAGAAMTNGILMDCKTPADCARNAAALQATADKMDAWKGLPAGVDKQKVRDALAHLKAGKVTAQDAQYLHQLTYAIARSAQGNNSPSGISVGSMYAAVGMLRSEGAFQSSEPTFHQAPLKNGSLHWTVSSGGAHANSYVEGGSEGRGKMSSTIPPEMDLKNPKAQAAITVTNGKYPDVGVQWKPVGGGLKKNQVYEANMEPTAFKAANGPDCVRVLTGVSSALSSQAIITLK